MHLASQVCPKIGSGIHYFRWGWDFAARLLSALIVYLKPVLSMGSKLLTLDEGWDVSGRLSSKLSVYLKCVPTMGSELLTLAEGGMFLTGSHLRQLWISSLSQVWDQNFSHWMRVGCLAKTLNCIDSVSQVCLEYGSKTLHFGWKWDILQDSQLHWFCVSSRSQAWEQNSSLWMKGGWFCKALNCINCMSQVCPNNETQWDIFETKIGHYLNWQGFESISSLRWDRLRTQSLRWYIWAILSDWPWDDMGYDEIWWNTRRHKVWPWDRLGINVHSQSAIA